jgi:hypothetical protein
MDLGGTSDPYVKIYLLPDKKRKHETKVGIFKCFLSKVRRCCYLTLKMPGKVRKTLFSDLIIKKCYYFQKADIQAMPISGF